MIISIIDYKESSRLLISLVYLLQFVSTIAITYTISKRGIRNEFAATLKESALSAYRRITDISKSLQLMERLVERKSKDGENV